MTLARSDFPLPDTEWDATREFWTGAAHGELRLPRCDACRAICWYPAKECRSCGADSFTWSPMSGRGTLFTWVVVRHAFLPQVRERVPFVTGLITLEEDPKVRLPTLVVDAEPEELVADMPMKVVFRELRFTGVERTVQAPMFRPIRTARR